MVFLKRFVAAFFFLLCFIIAQPAFATPFVSAAHSSQDIIRYAQGAGITKNTSWNVVYDSAGKPAASSLAQAVSLMNLYRYVAGVSPVTMNSTYQTKAQDAAEALAVTGEFGHNLTIRPSGWSDAKWESARDGAKHSNVGKGYNTFWRMMMGMVADHTGSNISVQGHRRWILGEDVAQTGPGIKGSASALWVVDSKSDFYSDADVAVAWPAAEQPLDLWQEGSPWSLSLPCDSDISRVSVWVTNTKTNQTWVFNQGSGNLWANNEDLSDAGAIVWLPTGLNPQAGDIFHVAVRGTGAGDFEYNVHFFDGGFAPSDGGWGTGSGGSGGWQPAPGIIIDINGNKLVRRLYNQWTGEHHYTVDGNEYFNLINAGWTYEGLAWMSPGEGTNIYRVYNRWTGEHLYTKSLNEKNALVRAGWNDEGIGFHEDAAHGKAVYRLYNPTAPSIASHHYTTDKHEYDVLQTQGWRGEGIAWYALAD